MCRPTLTKLRRARRAIKRLSFALFALGLLFGSTAGARAEEPRPLELQAGVTEHLGEPLGEPLPLGTRLVDHHGAEVRLGDFFGHGRPVLLVFGYHTCPMLCSLVQNATAHALRGLDWRVGRDLEVVVVSIDPADTPALAGRRREGIVARYAAGLPAFEPSPGVTDAGFHYLVGDAPSIAAVTRAAGFSFTYDAATKQFAHPAVIQIVSPAGRLARYLYGIDFDPRDLRFGLLEASAGRSVATIDRVLLYCVHYDASSGRYVVVASRVMQIGGAVVALLVMTLLATLWVRERRRRLRRGGAGVGPAPSAS